MANENKYFLPYQIDWLKDTSKIKIWEKSRRIGATYVQSYEDVRDCVSGIVPSVWFSSADESAAREYIMYCAQWAKLFDMGARDLGLVVLDPDKNIKTFTIQFDNGSRINALSSNPKAFRSKGGKVVLDEFAFHENAEDLWKAAKPCITWGFPLRILSTHQGQQSKFFKFIDNIRKGRLNWSLHTVTIQKAVEDGLADKILKHKTTEAERNEWLKLQEADCDDKTVWLEEYCCIAVDESTAFLSYNAIEGIEGECLLTDLEQIQNPLYIGVDIGRKKDLTVIWGTEKIGARYYTRFEIELEKTKFSRQREVLFSYMRHPRFSRACIDATGIGMQLAEECQDEFGKAHVDMITFTGQSKEELAYNLLTKVEDKDVVIPNNNDIREDLHSVRKVTTIAKNIRFDVVASGTTGHADRFWALALSVYAGKGSAGGDVNISSGGRIQIKSLLKGY